MAAPPADAGAGVLWRQFGATLDMLANAIRACPEARWGDRPGPHEFGYLVYHTLFWLDCYLAGSREGFAPPPPFTLDEMDPAGLLPDRVYTKAEMLLDNLRHVQHHAAQLNLLLRQETDSAPRWVARAKD